MAKAESLIARGLSSLSGIWQLPGTKKLVSLFVLILAFYFGWRRLFGRGGAGAAAANGGRRRNDNNNNNNAAAAAGAGGAGGAAFGGEEKQFVRRTPALSSHTPAGRTAKYLTPNPNGARRMVCVSTRVLLTGLTAANSDGSRESVDWATDESSATASSSSTSDVTAPQSFIRRLAACTNLYVITKVPTNPSALEERVFAALERGGVFAAGLKPHNVLFCSSAVGKSAMIRQLTPQLVIDDEIDVLEKLRPHLEDVIYVPAIAAGSTACGVQPSATATAACAAAGVHAAASIRQYFTASITVTGTATTATAAAPVPPSTTDRDVKLE